MTLLVPDASLAELALLDVIDVRLDGSCAVNEDFLGACRAAYRADPGRFDDIVPAKILARAMVRGLAEGLDVDALTLAVLEVGAAQVDA
jgi:hypothetical protein